MKWTVLALKVRALTELKAWMQEPVQVLKASMREPVRGLEPVAHSTPQHILDCRMDRLHRAIDWSLRSLSARRFYLRSRAVACPASRRHWLLNPKMVECVIEDRLLQLQLPAHINLFERQEAEAWKARAWMQLNWLSCLKSRMKRMRLHCIYTKPPP